MPHASRKKNQGPKKRLQITDDSGWTHVTKGTAKQKRQQTSTNWSYLHKGLRPTEIPRGLSLQEVVESFSRYTKTWRESLCLKNLETLLKDQVLVSDIRVTNCVCLGLGSLTGGYDTENSFYELAALVSILEILGQHVTGHFWSDLESSLKDTAQKSNEIKQVYMQDPVFNSLDEAFLRSLGYTIVPTPEGFEKIDETTFLFAPHLEWPIYLMALQKEPYSLCIGNDTRGFCDSRDGSIAAEAKAVYQNLSERCFERAMPDFHRNLWCLSTIIYWMRPRLESVRIENP